jgi:hypothetical protein
MSVLTYFNSPYSQAADRAVDPDQPTRTLGLEVLSGL